MTLTHKDLPAPAFRRSSIFLEFFSCYTASHLRPLGATAVRVVPVVPIESLPDERLDDGLSANVEVPSGLVQLLQHGRGEVHIDALNRLNHATPVLEETGNVLSLIR